MVGYNFKQVAPQKETVALVLAGGRGSRLHELTDNQSKPAVPFGGKFRIIDFPLSNCINSGIRRIGVLTQYKAHSLIQHLQRGWAFLQPELNEFVEIWPAQQQTEACSWYKGTADAIFQNISVIKSYPSKYVLILAGDHIYKQDYSIMLEQHIEQKADVTVSCLEVPLADASGFGVMAVDHSDNIISFVEKPKNPPCMPDNPDRALASMGIYIFNTEFLIKMLEEDAVDVTSSHDFGKDILPRLVEDERYRVVGHRFTDSCVYNKTNEAYWRDVGTLDAYWKANLDLTHVVPDLDIYDNIWPIWTYQPQRPAAKFVFANELRMGHALDSLVSSGCIVSGASVVGSLLFPDVNVHSFADISNSVILEGAEIQRHCRVKNAIIGQNCVVPRGLVIGEDLEADKRRFHVTDGGVVLVTKKMLDNLEEYEPIG